MVRQIGGRCRHQVQRLERTPVQQPATRYARLGIDDLARFLMGKAIDRIGMGQGQGAVRFLQQLFAQQVIQGVDGVQFVKPGNLAEVAKGGLLAENGNGRRDRPRRVADASQPALDDFLDALHNPGTGALCGKLRPVDLPCGGSPVVVKQAICHKGFERFRHEERLPIGFGKEPITHLG